MNDFFKAFVDVWVSFNETVPWLIPLFLSLLSFSFAVRCFLRLVYDDCPPSGWFLDLLKPVGRWLKNRFIDFLALFLSGETLYKLGLARLGKEYVECDTQDCSTCPFAGNCKLMEVSEDA